MKWTFPAGYGRRNRDRARGRRRSPALHSGSAWLEPRMLLSNVSVLQYRNDAGNTAQNLSETVLTPSDVNSTQFGKLYSYPVDGYIYTEPLYIANLAIPGQGTHNVVFVATENDSVYAFDADGGVGTNGAPIWHDSFINPAAGILPLDQADVFGATDIVPEIGITATPVIDLATGALYVEANFKHIENGVEHVVQELYALNVATGAQMYGGGVVIADTTVTPNSPGATYPDSYVYNSGPKVDGTGLGSVDGVLTFNALTQFERSALVLNDGIIYLSWSSRGDYPPNHGWVLGYSADGLEPTAVFCTTPNGNDGTIWGAGEGLAVDPEGDMYFITGNGAFETTFNAQGLPIDGDYGDSVVKIGLDPTTTAKDPNIDGWGLKVLDFFTPSDQQILDDDDLDFGSGGPLLLPATATGPQVVLAAGKAGTIFVIDTDTGKMGEYNPTQDDVYQEIQGQIGGIWGSPVYYDGTVYYGPVNDHIKAFQLQANNTLSTTPISESTQDFGYPGPNAAISADGSSDGILWVIDANAFRTEGTGVLYAYDASNLSDELYESDDQGTRDTSGGAVKFTVPLVTNGLVYVGGEHSLTIYGELTGVVVPSAPSNLTESAVSNSEMKLTWQDNSSNETGFTIERSTNGVDFTPVATIGPYVNTYTDLGLSGSTQYFYEVIATDSAGSSPPSNISVGKTAAPTLPSPWADTNIGGPPIPGAASFQAGVFTLNASGASIGSTADQFNFVDQTLTGDGTIYARVTSVGDTSPAAQAGIMIRQSLDANSPYVDLLLTALNTIDFQSRSAQGATTTTVDSLIEEMPYWLKLVRTGSTITAYTAPDFGGWSKLGSVTVPMSTQVYVGLSLASDNDSLVDAATIDNVSVSQATPAGYIAIEAGGGPTGTFHADEDESGGTTAQSTAAINISGVTDPAPVGVYQTARLGTFTYTIPGLTAGAVYTVRLHFSEDFDKTVGERLFGVTINGQQVLTDFDILAAAGAMDTAIVEQFSATANAQGQIVIAFAPSASSTDQNAEVNGIEVIPVAFNQRIAAQPATIAPIQAGQQFSGTLATFVDSDPGGLARNYLATITWGDGSVTTGVVQAAPSGGGFDVIGTHTYSMGGSFSPAVLIQSNDGSAVQVAVPLTVNSPLASADSPTTETVAAGSSTGQIAVGTFSDTDASPPAFNASIAWGDGVTSAGSIVPVTGGYSVVASHVYAAAGSYVPVVTVTSGGASLVTNDTTIDVSAAPPLVVTPTPTPSPPPTGVTPVSPTPTPTPSSPAGGSTSPMGPNPITSSSSDSAHDRKSHRRKAKDHMKKHHHTQHHKVSAHGHTGKKSSLHRNPDRHHEHETKDELTG